MYLSKMVIFYSNVSLPEGNQNWVVPDYRQLGNPQQYILDILTTWMMLMRNRPACCIMCNQTIKMDKYKSVARNRPYGGFLK